jgi:uncharacterized membrane protein AbrB (regulator of aidB expression)
MTPAAWLLIAATLALVAFGLVAIDLAEPRLTRSAKVAIVGAVVLMTWKPELWPWLTAAGLALCAAVLVLYLVAGVTAEVQRWRETRR